MSSGRILARLLRPKHFRGVGGFTLCPLCSSLSVLCVNLFLLRRAAEGHASRGAAGTTHSARKSTTAATMKSCPQEKRSTPAVLRRREDTPPNQAQVRQGSSPTVSAAGRGATLPTPSQTSPPSSPTWPVAPNPQLPPLPNPSPPH